MLASKKLGKKLGTFKEQVGRVQQNTKIQNNRVVVFNMGLHLLGGYVSMDRWVPGLDSKGTPLKAHMVRCKHIRVGPRPLV